MYSNNIFHNNQTSENTNRPEKKNKETDRIVKFIYNKNPKCKDLCGIDYTVLTRSIFSLKLVEIKSTHGFLQGSQGSY